MKDGRRLFDEVVGSSGLAAWIGPGTVQRALHSVGAVSPDTAGVDHYRRALPQLKARMAIYLSSSELDQRMRAIEQIVG
jgi:hypothetical protein